MKKKIVIPLIICSIFLISTNSIKADTEKTSIVCTNSVLADFTSNLIRENVTIEYIMPSGACPSHFDTCPSDIALISSADIIISLGWEPWLSSILESSENTEVEEIKCIGLGEWSYPTNAKKYVEKIRDELIFIFPEKNETINKNAQEYIAEIEETENELLDMVNISGYADKKVICMEWYNEFIKWLGFNLTYSYGPPEGLSTQDMINITNAAINNDITAIIDNLQSGTEFGASISSESGASHIIFSNFPGAVPSTDTYIDTIKYNTQQLINGIKTYEYKKGDIADLEKQLNSLELQRNIAFFVSLIFIILSVLFLILYKKK